MPESFTPAAAQVTFDAFTQHMRVTLQGLLNGLDARDPAAISFAVKALLTAHFEPKELAERLGVSRTTISRWGQNQNIPRSIGYRVWVIETLREFLNKAVLSKDEMNVPAADE
jgi:hypothetical protein